MNIFILKRNSIFFYLSFFTAGTQTIVTQLFYNNHYFANKEILLPLTLILGAIAYILGVMISGKYLNVSVIVVKIFLGINMLAFICLFLVETVYLYILLYIIACFTCNFIFNLSDHNFIKISNGNIDAHIKTMLVYQTSAYVISPVFFSFSFGNNFLIFPVIIIMAVFTYFNCIKGSNYKNVCFSQLDKTTDNIKNDLSMNDKTFIVYVFIFLSIFSLAISMLTYFLSDYYKLTNYDVKSGIIIGLMSVLTVLSVITYKGKYKEDQEISIEKTKRLIFRPIMQVGLIVISFISIVLFLIKISTSFIYVLCVLSLLGLCYGLFISTARKFTSVISLKANKPKLLTVFNNLQSGSMLLGYVISVFVWILNKVVKNNYYILLIWTILSLLLLEFIILAIWNFEKE